MPLLPGEALADEGASTVSKVGSVLVVLVNPPEPSLGVSVEGWPDDAP